MLHFTEGIFWLFVGFFGVWCVLFCFYFGPKSSPSNKNWLATSCFDENWEQEYWSWWTWFLSLQGFIHPSLSWQEVAASVYFRVTQKWGTKPPCWLTNNQDNSHLFEIFVQNLLLELPIVLHSLLLCLISEKCLKRDKENALFILTVFSVFFFLDHGI